ncbi:MAG: hypothetical protein ACMG55_04800 [Microcoleus sp.]
MSIAIYIMALIEHLLPRTLPRGESINSEITGIIAQHWRQNQPISWC